MRLLAPAIALSLVLAGCSPGDLPTDDPSPPEERRERAGRAVLLQEDFSDARLGWLGPEETSIEGPDADMELVGDRLRIFVKTDRARVGVDTIGLETEEAGALEALADVRMQVDAERTTTPAGHAYGMACRVQGLDTFYGFLLTAGGRFAIVKVSEGETEELAGGRSDLVSEGEVGSNRIGAECAGSQLRMFVDDELLGEAEDDDLLVGAVGLVAETRGQADLEVFFDDLIVREARATRQASPSPEG